MRPKTKTTKSRERLPVCLIGIARCPRCRALAEGNTRAVKKRHVCEGWTRRTVYCTSCERRYIIESMDDAELRITK